MSPVATTERFKENAHEALGDARLQRALVHTRNFIPRRADAAARLPEFDTLRDSARDIKNHTLANLDLYLEIYEAQGSRGRRPCALGARRGGGAQDFSRSRQGAGRQARDQGQVDGLGRDRAQSGDGGRRHRGRRDRPRRICHPTAPRVALAYHRAGDPCHARRRSRPISARRT